MVAQEVIHNMNKSKRMRVFVAFKVDLLNAYDKLSCDFIWHILEEIKFPSKMINIIMHTVTSVETNIKWNRSRLEFFHPGRGNHRGDPISMYMYSLCID